MVGDVEEGLGHMKPVPWEGHGVSARTADSSERGLARWQVVMGGVLTLIPWPEGMSGPHKLDL